MEPLRDRARRECRRPRTRAQYTSLRETYLNLVGTLYPSIVYAELCALRARYGPGADEDLPWVAEPRCNGAAP